MSMKLRKRRVVNIISNYGEKLDSIFIGDYITFMEFTPEKYLVPRMYKIVDFDNTKCIFTIADDCTNDICYIEAKYAHTLTVSESDISYQEGEAYSLIVSDKEKEYTVSDGDMVSIFNEKGLCEVPNTTVTYINVVNNQVILGNTVTGEIVLGECLDTWVDYTAEIYDPEGYTVKKKDVKIIEDNDAVDYLFDYKYNIKLGIHQTLLFEYTNKKTSKKKTFKVEAGSNGYEFDFSLNMLGATIPKSFTIVWYDKRSKKVAVYDTVLRGNLIWVKPEDISKYICNDKDYKLSKVELLVNEQESKIYDPNSIYMETENNGTIGYSTIGHHLIFYSHNGDCFFVAAEGDLVNYSITNSHIKYTLKDIDGNKVVVENKLKDFLDGVIKYLPTTEYFE